MKKFLLPSLIIGLLYFAWRKASGVFDKVKVEIESFKINRFSALQLGAVAKINITNPTSFLFTAEKLSIDFFYKGIFLFTTNLKGPINLKADSTTPLTFPVSIPISSFTSGAAQIITDVIKTKSIPEIQLRGVITFKNGFLPFDITKKLIS